MQLDDFISGSGSNPSLSGPAPTAKKEPGITDYLAPFARMHHASRGDFGQAFSALPADIPKEEQSSIPVLGSLSKLALDTLALPQGVSNYYYRQHLGLPGSATQFNIGDIGGHKPTFVPSAGTGAGPGVVSPEVQAATKQEGLKHKAIYDAAVAAAKKGDVQTAEQLLQQWRNEAGLEGAISRTAAGIATDPLMLLALPTKASVAMAPALLEGGVKATKGLYDIAADRGISSPEFAAAAPEALTAAGFAGLSGLHGAAHLRRGIKDFRSQRAAAQEAAPPVQDGLSPRESGGELLALQEAMGDLERQAKPLSEAVTQRLNEALARGVDILNTELAARIPEGQATEAGLWPGAKQRPQRFEALTPEVIEALAQRFTPEEAQAFRNAAENWAAFQFNDTVYIGKKGLDRITRAKDVKGMTDNLVKFLTHEYAHGSRKAEGRPTRVFDPMTGEEIVNPKRTRGDHFGGAEGDSLIEDINLESRIQGLENILRKNPEFADILRVLESNPEMAQSLVQEGLLAGHSTYAPEVLDLQDAFLDRPAGPGGRRYRTEEAGSYVQPPRSGETAAGMGAGDSSFFAEMIREKLAGLSGKAKQAKISEEIARLRAGHLLTPAQAGEIRNALRKAPPEKAEPVQAQPAPAVETSAPPAPPEVDPTTKSNRWSPQDQRDKLAAARTRLVKSIADSGGVSPEVLEKHGITLDNLKKLLNTINANRSNTAYDEARSIIMSKAFRNTARGTARRGSGFTLRELGLSDRILDRVARGQSPREWPSSERAAQPVSGQVAEGQKLARDSKRIASDALKSKSPQELQKAREQIESTRTFWERVKDRIASLATPGQKRDLENQIISHTKTASKIDSALARLEATRKRGQARLEKKAAKESTAEEVARLKKEIEALRAKQGVETTAEPESQQTKVSEEDLANLEDLFSGMGAGRKKKKAPVEEKKLSRLSSEEALALSKQLVKERKFRESERAEAAKAEAKALEKKEQRLLSPFDREVKVGKGSRVIPAGQPGFLKGLAAKSRKTVRGKTAKVWTKLKNVKDAAGNIISVKGVKRIKKPQTRTLDESFDQVMENLRRGYGAGRVVRNRPMAPSVEGSNVDLKPKKFTRLKFGWLKDKLQVKQEPITKYVQEQGKAGELPRPQGPTRVAGLSAEQIVRLKKQYGAKKTGLRKPLSEAQLDTLLKSLGPENLERTPNWDVLPEELRRVIRQEFSKSATQPPTVGSGLRGKWRRPKVEGLKGSELTDAEAADLADSNVARLAAKRAKEAEQSAESAKDFAEFASRGKRVETSRVAPPLTEGPVTKIEGSPVKPNYVRRMVRVSQLANRKLEMTNHLKNVVNVGEDILSRITKADADAKAKGLDAKGRRRLAADLQRRLIRTAVETKRLPRTAAATLGDNAHQLARQLMDSRAVLAGLEGKEGGISKALAEKLGSNLPPMDTPKLPAGTMHEMTAKGSSGGARVQKLSPGMQFLWDTLKAQGKSEADIRAELGLKSVKVAAADAPKADRTSFTYETLEGPRRTPGRLTEGTFAPRIVPHPNRSGKKRGFEATLRQEGGATSVAEGFGERLAGEIDPTVSEKGVEAAKVSFSHGADPSRSLGAGMFSKFEGKFNDPDVKKALVALNKSAAEAFQTKDFGPRLGKGEKPASKVRVPKDVVGKISQIVRSSKTFGEFHERFNNLVDGLYADGVLRGGPALAKFRKDGLKYAEKVRQTYKTSARAEAERVLGGADKAIAKADQVLSPKDEGPSGIGAATGKARTVFEKAGEETIRNRKLNDTEATLDHLLGIAEKSSGFVKSGLTGGDLSNPFRQTLLLTARQAIHEPRQLAQSLKEMVKSYSEKNWDAYKRKLKADPKFNDAVAAGLNFSHEITDHDNFKGVDWMANLLARGKKKGKFDPRRWAAEIGEKYIVGAGRAYTHYQNKIMLDTWKAGEKRLKDYYTITAKKGNSAIQFEIDAKSNSAAKYINKLKADGYTLTKQPHTNNVNAIRELTDLINTFASRSRITTKFVNKAGNVLLFSPQMIKSRLKTAYLNFGLPFDVPTETARKTISGGRMYDVTPVRQFGHEMVRDTIALGAGIGALTYGLAKANGLNPEIEKDPRSTDFAKIRMGHTTVNPYGDLQQYIRVGAQVITSSEKLRGSGRVQKTDRSAVIGRAFRGKMAPLAGLAYTLFIAGQTGGGQETKTPAGMLAAVKDAGVPLMLSDAMDIAVEHPDALAPYLMSLAAIGITVQAGANGKPWITDYDTSQADIAVSDEIRRLKLEPPKVGTRVPLKGRNTLGQKYYYSLRPEERQAFANEAMPAITNSINELIKSEEYKAMSDERKRKVLNRKIKAQQKRWSTTRKLRKQYSDREPVNEWWEDND